MIRVRVVERYAERLRPSTEVAAQQMVDMEYRGYTLRARPYGDGESYFTVHGADGSTMGANESLAGARKVVDILMGESRPLRDQLT